MATGNKRIIKHRAFIYYVDGAHPVTGEERLVERLAYRGEEVELREQDIKRGEFHGAFLTDEEKSAASESEVVAEEGVTTEDGRPLGDLDDDELIEWLEEEKPNVNETVAAAGGDADLASRLLDAENSVTGRDAREGVEAGLAKVIERAS